MAEAMVPDVVVSAPLPGFVVDLEEARRQMKLLQDFIKGQMEEGVDFGKVEGIDKPTLLKPGAEKLDNIYGFSAQYDLVNETWDWEKGFFAFTFRCRVINKRTGVVEGEALGHANSKEAKYRYQWVFEWNVPEDQRAGLKSRVLQKGNYKGKRQYRVENTDPYTLVNTLLKMAQKRAHVGATLAATRTSGIFTQDVEDMFPDDDGEASAGPAGATATKATAGASAPARSRRSTAAAAAPVSDPPPFVAGDTAQPTDSAAQVTAPAPGASGPSEPGQPQTFVLKADPTIGRGRTGLGAKIPAVDAAGNDVMLFAVGDPLLEKVKEMAAGQKILAVGRPERKGFLITEVLPDAA